MHVMYNYTVRRSGVDKVIEDVKGVQKEINNQNGKLERTFIELSTMMQRKVNNKEPYVEQGLELTRRIHNNCYNIVETIRWEYGNNQRSKLNLQFYQENWICEPRNS